MHSSGKGSYCFAVRSRAKIARRRNLFYVTQSRFAKNYQILQICTCLPKILFFIKRCWKVKKKLSTLKVPKNVIKSSFTQSYPHYPHKIVWKVWIKLSKKRTGVLWRYNKNVVLSKKIIKKLDFWVVKNHRENIITILKIQTFLFCKPIGW